MWTYGRSQKGYWYWTRPLPNGWIAVVWEQKSGGEELGQLYGAAAYHEDEEFNLPDAKLAYGTFERAKSAALECALIAEAKKNVTS